MYLMQNLTKKELLRLREASSKIKESDELLMVCMNEPSLGNLREERDEKEFKGKKVRWDPRHKRQEEKIKGNYWKGRLGGKWKTFRPPDRNERGERGLRRGRSRSSLCNLGE